MPKARRPTNTSEDRTSPPFRIARPPDVPGIFEEEEPDISSTEDPDKQHSPSRKKSKTKPRLSASKLPLPARGQSPSLVPPSAEIHFVDITTVATSFKPRKGSRRQSGLLTVNTDSLSVPRSGSPAFGSPIRLEAGLAEAQEEMAAAQDNVVYDIPARAIDTINIETKKDKRKGKSQEVRETDANNDAPRDKKKAKESTESNNLIKPKTSRGALQPIDRNGRLFETVSPAALTTLESKNLQTSITKQFHKDNFFGPHLLMLVLLAPFLMPQRELDARKGYGKVSIIPNQS